MNKLEEFKFLDAYAPIFYSKKRYFVISGGRASGKSTQLAAYFIVKLLGDDYFRGVVSRYTQRSLKHSIYRDILDLIENWGIKDYIQLHGDEIKNKHNNNSIITHSFRIGDNTAVAKGKGLASPTMLLIDEAQELPNEEEYIKTIDSFRTPGVHTQIFLLFNPGTKHHWLYERFFLHDFVSKPEWEIDHHFLHTTYKDNQFDGVFNFDYDKITEWERMKETDPDYYSHHIMGNWSLGKEGKIFNDWKSSNSPDPEAPLIYGLDFGFSNDPSACIEVRKHNNKMWIKEILYKKGLTNNDIFDNLKQNISLDATIIADSAEPKSIEELRRLGFINIKPCYKGADSIRAGINKIKEYEVNVLPGSDNLWREYDLYSWSSNTDKPVDADNHLIDALRYTISQEPHKQTEVFSISAYDKLQRLKKLGEMYK